MHPVIASISEENPKRFRDTFESGQLPHFSEDDPRSDSFPFTDSNVVRSQNNTCFPVKYYFIKAINYRSKEKDELFFFHLLYWFSRLRKLDDITLESKKVAAQEEAAPLVPQIKDSEFIIDANVGNG